MDPDQTARMRRLVLIHAGRKHINYVGFVMAQLIYKYIYILEKGLETLQEMCCIDVLIQTMKAHLQNADIIGICLVSLENICKAG
jgi:hypothetical protein